MSTTVPVWCTCKTECLEDDGCPTHGVCQETDPLAQLAAAAVGFVETLGVGKYDAAESQAALSELKRAAIEYAKGELK